MATDIVGSLFGVSPEMYQEDRNRQGMRDAIAMAQLDPMQYANDIDKQMGNAMQMAASNPTQLLCALVGVDKVVTIKTAYRKAENAS